MRPRATRCRNFRRVIDVDELRKTYDAVEAVRGVSFEVDAGEVFGFLGPNGAGKTTTINMLCTLAKPTSGRATVAGHDVVTERDDVRRNIGLVFQDPTLDGYLTAEQNLRLHAELYGVDASLVATRMQQMLEMVGLWERRGTPVNTFSGGMRRRLEIARGLMHSPRVLFLDEPTIGLDPLQVRHVRELLAGLAGECTILLSTHLLAEAEGLCQRVLMLMQGKLVSDVAVNALKQQAGFEIELGGRLPECEALLRNLPGARTVELISTQGQWHTFAVAGDAPQMREQAAAECLKRGLALRELRGTSGTLEDHFVRIAARGRREAA